MLLYFHTVGSISLTTFPGFSVLAEWYLGVSIDLFLNFTPTMTKLGIESAGLIGTIPPRIATTYPNLAHLSFAKNNLTGTIPPEIGNMSNLAVLYARAMVVFLSLKFVPNLFHVCQMASQKPPGESHSYFPRSTPKATAASSGRK